MGDNDQPRILIVDDDPTIREMLSIFLEQEYGRRGYVIETHGGGRRRWSRRRAGATLGLLDIDMPDLGAWRRCAAWRTLHETVPVDQLNGRPRRAPKPD